MFTGLVQGVARIVQVEAISAAAAGHGLRLTVDAGAVPGFAAAVGDSIALNGACMTATAVNGTRFNCEVSAASLAATVGLDGEGEVNLEASLRVGDALGGHFVAGHVDGVGEVVTFTPAGESWHLVIRAPPAFARYIAFKGSIAVDGVSLTINNVRDLTGAAGDCEFAVNIIAHTLAMTTLRHLQPGQRVNLEVDMIARYLERMLAATSPRP